MGNVKAWILGRERAFFLATQPQFVCDCQPSGPFVSFFSAMPFGIGIVILLFCNIHWHHFAFLALKDSKRISCVSCLFFASISCVSCVTIYYMSPEAVYMKTFIL